MRLRRCPRCGALPASYIEVWDGHGIHFDAEDGIPVDVGYLFEGNPSHVIALCGCGHRWQLRGIRQITELRE